MNIIIAPYVYIDGVYKRDQAVIFDEKIHHICDADRIPENFSNITPDTLKPTSVLYPGFINAHVHLEFSSNMMTLDYGGFLPWLESVMANRDMLSKKSDNISMQKALDEMLSSGITAIGAISSFGNDLEVCAKAKQRVVYFNEIIGSNEALIDDLYDTFLERFYASTAHNSDRFRSAVAIHSPYSVHPGLLKKILAFAKEHNAPLSTHFLESREEREWLETNGGGFRAFFEKLFGIKESVTDIEHFLEAFKRYPALFVHATQANKKELKALKNAAHSIVHCPRSNRLLAQKRLKIEELESIPLLLATDGKSSNWSLNIFDELRAALMLHSHLDLHMLSHMLLRSITAVPAQALELNCGIIAEEKNADFCVVCLQEEPKKLEDIALWTILHTDTVDKVYIKGELRV